MVGYSERFPSLARSGVLGMSRGSTPRHAQMAGDLGFAVMLKLRGILRSSAILGSDSPQSNNRMENSLWVTPVIPRERPNVKHAIAGYLRLPRPTPAPVLMRVLHWLHWRNQGMPLAIRPKIIARYEEAAAALG